MEGGIEAGRQGGAKEGGQGGKEAGGTGGEERNARAGAGAREGGRVQGCRAEGRSESRFGTLSLSPWELCRDALRERCG